MSEPEFRFRSLEFLNLYTFQDILLPLTAFKIKWRFHSTTCKTPHDLVLVYLSSFIIYYYSFLLNIPQPSYPEWLIAWFMLYLCLQYFMTSVILIIHLKCSLLWETLPDTYSMCFMLFLCVPLESCAFLFHNVYHIVLCLPAFTLDCEFLRAQIPHLYGLTPTIQ